MCARPRSPRHPPLRTCSGCQCMPGRQRGQTMSMHSQPVETLSLSPNPRASSRASTAGSPRPGTVSLKTRLRARRSLGLPAASEGRSPCLKTLHYTGRRLVPRWAQTKDFVMGAVRPMRARWGAMQTAALSAESSFAPGRATSIFCTGRRTRLLPMLYSSLLPVHA